MIHTKICNHVLWYFDKTPLLFCTLHECNILLCALGSHSSVSQLLPYTLTEHFIRNTCTPTYSLNYLMNQLCCSSAKWKKKWSQWSQPWQDCWCLKSWFVCFCNCWSAGIVTHGLLRMVRKTKTSSERHLLMATSSLIMHHVSNWFHEHDNEFNVLQSPDLNPIQPLWDVVEREIFSMNVPLTNLQKLHDANMSTWNRISKECFQHLVESMPWRIEAVLREKGGHTQY